MSNKALQLTNVELELTQQMQMHFPRGVIPQEMLLHWIRGEKGILVEAMIKMLSGGSADQTLVCVSLGKEIILGSCNGEKTIASSQDVFNAIDPDFVLDDGKPKKLIGDTAVEVYKSNKDATFAKMFCSLGGDLDQLCLTQHQIRTFCAHHQDWIPDGDDDYGAFFLFKGREQYFVANVRRSSHGLSAERYHFGFEHSWVASRGCRIVAPRQP